MSDISKEVQDAISKAAQGHDLTNEERALVAKHFTRKGPSGWKRILSAGDKVEIHGLSGTVKTAGRRNLVVVID